MCSPKNWRNFGQTAASSPNWWRLQWKLLTRWSILKTCLLGFITRKKHDTKKIRIKRINMEGKASLLNLPFKSLCRYAGLLPDSSQEGLQHAAASMYTYTFNYTIIQYKCIERERDNAFWFRSLRSSVFEGIYSRTCAANRPKMG